ncbi:MAG: BREX-2 system adenine-specific DNA-methyltransferase PglX [Deltaproteobacteria bacterium]|nr:BREX-2 system adenine-specific DNA-methyltransferase PglX [Deltaproteobacteria bacterium]
MKPADRTRLTTALRDHVAKVAEDLRGQMTRDAEVRAKAKQLHADEQVGDDFDVWTDLLARRAAVLWVLKSVYIRVLEDRGLLAPVRILDVEAQQLFERLAPNLGETAFLRWVYRDLASKRGGLPELFSAQPAEIGAPSDELSRELLEFWRHKDADSGAHWSFKEEQFEGELMGDLYQELDPVVKDRFALCQTPDFVRKFMLDRTLTPAIEAFGADKVRLLDPACGSGHFLIDGLKRLVAATTEKHPDWTRKDLVAHCLDRVVGIDLNDYACALARARLVMTAAQLAGVESLDAASQFHPHVYWADGLEQLEKDADKPPLQYGLLEEVKEKPRATLRRSDVRAALREVFKDRFHAVIANPPYILERDDAKKAYHREKLGKQRRYVSASGKYSLASPFTERCFELAVKAGFVGLITSNNFMKREFGKTLIQKVLARRELKLVVDTSQAYIPFHGTPTVLLFARNQSPAASATVRAVLGKRGESGTPEDPANGRVWMSIVEGWDQVGFENEYVSIADLPHELLTDHPWSLRGGGAVELKQRVECQSERRLGDIAQHIGPVAICGEDEVYIIEGRVPPQLVEHTVPLGVGDCLRDWSLSRLPRVILPYESVGGDPLIELPTAAQGWLEPHKSRLRARAAFGVLQEDRGKRWFEYRDYYPDKLRSPLSIAFAFVATHNHFVLDRGGKVFNRSAPVIKLPAGASEEDHLALLGLLNSSTACFWMKQIFHPKGTTAANRNHPDPARAAYEFAATGLQAFPIPDVGPLRSRIVTLARLLDGLAAERADRLGVDAVQHCVAEAESGAELRAALDRRWREADVLRERMVGLQEELDWVCYVAFGLAPKSILLEPDQYATLTCPRGDRPFERIAGRVSTVRSGGRALALDEGEIAPIGALPDGAEDAWGKRQALIGTSDALQLLETSVFKRSWRETEQNLAEGLHRQRTDEKSLKDHLYHRLEEWSGRRTAAFSISQMAAGLQDDRKVLVVAEALAGRQDFSLANLFASMIVEEAVPNHPAHVYTAAGLAKRNAWERTWSLQRKEDTGEDVGQIPVPPEYSQGSRGKSKDFADSRYWTLRGKLDVPKERFIAFTEVPSREGDTTLYGWAGWTPVQRLKAILAIDEGLEDGGVPLADRTGLLDSAWRLLLDAAREDASATSRLKAELQALAGANGPSEEMLEDWKARFPPPKGKTKH